MEDFQCFIKTINGLYIIKEKIIDKVKEHESGKIA